MAGRLSGMWRSPQLSVLLRYSFSHGAPPPGKVIHASRPGLVGSRPFITAKAYRATCRNRDPAGEGRNRAGPSSRDEVRVLQPLLHHTQERR